MSLSRSERLLGSALVCTALLAATTASPARAQVPDDQEIDLQLFYPAVGPQRFLTVAAADIMEARQLQLGLSVNYMTGVLTVYNVDPMDNLTTRTEVVQSVFSGQLGGAYGLLGKFHLGVTLPITFTMSGDGLDAQSGDPIMGGLSVTGFGDMLVEVAYAFYDNDGLTLTALPGVSLPTSMSLAGEGVESGAFLGDDLPSFRPRAALTWVEPGGKLTVGANLGFQFRKPRRLYNTEVGQQVTFAAAAAYHATAKLDVIAELTGRNGFSLDLDASPLELDGAVRVGVTRSLDVLVGGGAGLTSGLGAPGLRVFAGVSWSPDYGDTDGDGVNNMKDKCPLEAEDKDGFQDSDGCPETDNDEDKLDDLEDKCPIEAEDKDGFEDDDGCPEADNDKDGLLDEKDRCPSDAEDKIPPYDTDGCPATKRDSDDDGIVDALDKCVNDYEDMDGFGDDDGCPEEDFDADGVNDEEDKCPTEPEDKDGHEDGDGCAELDNDGDGFTDASDACPNERETVNGKDDGDGCPDSGGKVLARVDGRQIVVNDKVRWNKAEPHKKLLPALDQVALLIRGAPRVKKWRVVVSAEKQKTEEATRQLSQQRADAVRAYLLAKGVPADRIEAVGVVSDKPAFFVVAIEIEGVGDGDGDAAPIEEEPAPTIEEEPAVEIQPE